MNDIIELILCGICFAGLGIFFALYDFFRQQKPRQFGKTQIMSLGFIFGGICFCFIPFLSDPVIFIPLVLICIGIPLVLSGAYDMNLVKKCTFQINAVCVYCSSRKGKYRPIFEYTYKGNHYKATSQQMLSSNIIVWDKSYRIYINPNKPQCNIIFPKSLKDSKTTALLGAVLTAAGIALLIMFTCTSFSIF